MREEKRYKNSQGAIESKKADLTQEKQKLIDEVKAKTTTSFIHTASVLQKVKRNKKKTFRATSEANFAINRTLNLPPPTGLADSTV